MAVRERFHREIFAGGTEESLMAEARAVQERMSGNGWEFSRWYWDSEEEARKLDTDTVLVLWLRWVGEQQSQEPMRDEARQVGGWNTGTRALPVHEMERERRMAELEAGYKVLVDRVQLLERYTLAAQPKDATVITGELSPVSPGPREWTSQ
jgi:hypothetical protein